MEMELIKCCDHTYNMKHESIDHCYKCIELAKIKLTEVSKSYLMEFIATQMEILNEFLNDEEIEDMLKKLEEIYDSKLRTYSYLIYKDSYKINKTDLYILTGYILDKDLSNNDLFVKKIILSELIKNHTEFYNILSLEKLEELLEELKKIAFSHELEEEEDFNASEREWVSEQAWRDRREEWGLSELEMYDGYTQHLQEYPQEDKTLLELVLALTTNEIKKDSEVNIKPRRRRSEVEAVEY